jgi:hypothetical protein
MMKIQKLIQLIGEYTVLLLLRASATAQVALTVLLRHIAYKHGSSYVCTVVYCHY